MKNRVGFFILFVMGILSAYSQTVITGTVKNEKGEPMPATVLLQTRQGSMKLFIRESVTRFLLPCVA